MSTPPKETPPGDDHGSLGEKSTKHTAHGHSVHKAGLQSDAEQKTGEKAGYESKRGAHKVPPRPAKKGGR